MRRVVCLPVLLSLALLAPSRVGADDKAKFELEDGFELLFNGKDLTGWKEFSDKKESLKGKTEAYKGRFKVSEGKIVIDPTVKGDKHIETERQFGKDAHIKFDFKPGPKCNNDLFIRGSKFDVNPTAKELKDVKEGEWHAFEIVITGDKIEHKVNGKTVRSAKTGTKDAEKSTSFRIRAEFGEMEIKNVRAKKE